MRLSISTFSLTLPLVFLLSPDITQAESASNAGVKVEKLLETEKAWDGSVYKTYPEGTPQLTVLKITVAPQTHLDWHTHPVPNAAYMLSGVLTVEKKSGGEKRIFKAGEALPETVGTVHRGYTGDEGATLVVFYAGKKGLPLSQPAK